MGDLWNSFLKVVCDADAHFQYFKQLITEELGNVTKVTKPALLADDVTLENHQVEGFCWLKSLYLHGYNGILADEMGLGKTAQVIAFICALKEIGFYSPHIIFCPVSTLSNWKAEFHKFSPKCPIFVYYGDEVERSKQRNELMSIMNSKRSESCPVIISSHLYISKEMGFLSKFNWRTIIVDEGHILKNYRSKNYQNLFSYNHEALFILTGTPIQNNMTELWALLHLIVPSVFKDVSTMDKLTAISSHSFDKSILDKLHRILDPFVLRRTKADVGLGLLPKREVIVYVPITDIQKDMLEYLYCKHLINKAASDRMGQRLTRKRKYKETEPTVTTSSEKQFIEKHFESYKNVRPSSQNGIRAAIDCLQHPYLVQMPIDEKGYFISDHLFLNASGKMSVLMEMISHFISLKEKVLVFSTRTQMLDFIEESLLKMQIRYCRFDGSNKKEEREKQVDQFINDPRRKVFLLSSRAGGLGINLVVANNVIIYNNDWNPQVDLQCQDRCHRIGQTKPVTVYKLVVKDSPDEYVLQNATSKRELEALVLEQGRFTFDRKLNSSFQEDMERPKHEKDDDLIFEISNTYQLPEAVKKMIDLARKDLFD